MTVRTHDLFWAAGFMEGEGSFQNQRNNISLSAVQVQREPLERLHSLFGGTICACKKRGEKCSDFFKWQVTGTPAAGLAMTLFSLMSPRRKDQIEAALTKWRHAPLANGKRTVCARGHTFDDANTYRTPKGYRACRACRNVARDSRPTAQFAS
jgi:hypothetical protein